jgi:hypothetical protein
LTKYSGLFILFPVVHVKLISLHHSSLKAMDARKNYSPAFKHYNSKPCGRTLRKAVMRRILFNLLILSLGIFNVSCESGTETSTLLYYSGNPRLLSETRIFDNAYLVQNKKSLDDRLKTLYSLEDQ